MRFVDVVEARNPIVADWCRPTFGLDDEEDRVIADRDPVSASPIRRDDVAPIRNGDSPNAEVESVLRAIVIAVVEYHSRGALAAGLGGGCRRSRDQYQKCNA